MKIYQVDAFTNSLFGGNPAAVCPLDDWLADSVLQNIAAENNLAETAFFVPKGDHYELRWFTPAVEVDLCGHATLAAAFVLFHYEGHSGDIIRFQSRHSGELTVTQNEDLLTLNFPADELYETELTDDILAAFDKAPKAAFQGKTDLMLLFDNEQELQAVQPDFRKIATFDCRGVIITAPGSEVDFVSRFFTPQCGIDEDPVTGSAHTSLTPYWAKQLGKNKLSAMQLSKRVGHLKCVFLKERVEISGNARLYLTGNLHLKD